MERGFWEVRTIDIEIIYEDNHLLVVKKPVNILSQEDNTGDQDILNLLKEKIKIRDKKPGNVYLGLVHRLDRPVGGVMVFAKTSKCASRLFEQIQNGEFKKTYLAVSYGVFSKKEGRLLDYLSKDRQKNIVSVVPAKTKGAKKAILDYKVLEEKSDLSLLQISLFTGRSHQIRVQMMNSGHSLYGDQKYSSGLAKRGEQIALWSKEISLKHPTLKKEMTFTSYPDAKKPWSFFALEDLKKGI